MSRLSDYAYNGLLPPTADNTPAPKCRLCDESLPEDLLPLCNYSTATAETGLREHSYVHLNCVKFMKETVHGNYHCPDKNCPKIFTLKFNDETLKKTHLRQKRVLYRLNIVCFVLAALFTVAFVLTFSECTFSAATQRCFDISYIFDITANVMFWLAIFLHLPLPEYYVYFQGCKSGAINQLRLELIISTAALVVGLSPLLVLGDMFARSFQSGMFQTIATVVLLPAIIYSCSMRYRGMVTAIEAMRITMPSISIAVRPPPLRKSG